MALTRYLALSYLAMNIAAYSSASQDQSGNNVNIIATGVTGTLSTGNGLLITGGNVLPTPESLATSSFMPASAPTSSTPIHTSLSIATSPADVTPSTSSLVSGSQFTHSTQYPLPTLYTGAAARVGVHPVVVITSGVVSILIILCFF